MKDKTSELIKQRISEIMKQHNVSRTKALKMLFDTEEGKKLKKQKQAELNQAKHRIFGD